MSDKLTPDQRGLVQRAKEAVDRNNFDYALQLLKPIVNTVPGHVPTRSLLRKAAIGKFKAASALARGMSGVKVAPLQMKASGLVGSDPAAAMAAIEDALEIDPFNAGSNQTLATAAEALGLQEVVYLAYETIREGKPDDKANLEKLGNLYLQGRKPEQAQKVFEALVQLDPTNGEAIKGAKDASAMAAEIKGKWDQSGDYRDSLNNSEQARQLEQENRVVKDDSSLEEEIGRLTVEYQMDQNNVDTVKKLADLHERKKDIPSAISFYDWAIHLTNNADVELVKKAATLRGSMAKQAIKAKELELETATAETRAGIEAELEALRKQESASKLQHAKEQCDRYPNDKGLKYEYAEALVATDNFSEALPQLQQAVNQPSCRHKALMLLGKCYEHKGVMNLAEKQYATAVSEMETMDDTKKTILYLLGQVQRKQDKKSEALETFTQIYEVDYNYKDVAPLVESGLEG